MGENFMVSIGSDFFETKSVVLATGVEFSKKIEGEDEFLGKGTSYCATCDGFFYRGKTIAVVGSSKEAEKELDYLAYIFVVTSLKALVRAHLAKLLYGVRSYVYCHFP
jgi:thioredoxin reductase (NADPH)